MSEQTTVDFPCSACGGEMQWDPDRDALTCKHCDRSEPVQRATGAIVERALSDVEQAAVGLGVEHRISECKNCSARISFDGPATTQRCLYCGSPNILSQAANRNLIRPESLVPLDVGREQVKTHFTKWIRGLWFRPNALKKTRRFDAAGVYIPYWTFDVDVDSHWSADAGYYYYVNRQVQVVENGRTVTRTRRERRTRWVPKRGRRSDHYDDYPIAASSSIPGHLAKRLGRFQTSGLVPYQPQYLAGWHAEEYQLDLQGGWKQAQGDIVAEQRRRCSGDVPGDTQRSLMVDNRFEEPRWKHVLFPLWSLDYTFGGKNYTVLINGQTGAVAGDAPLSWIKIGLTAAVVIGAAVALFMLSGR